MKVVLFFILLLPAIVAFTQNDEHKTLAIGSPAPNFKLPGTDGKTYNLASFKNAGILVIVFTCNHCPTAQAYEDRIIQLAKDYSAKNVAVVAISPNDPKSVRLDELGYTDMSDSFDEMKLRAKQKKYNFPYLYDGDAQTTAKAYGPVATPHVFIFDKGRILRYQGRIDNVEKPTKTPTELNTRDAIEALLQNKPVPVATTKVFGCSVKWAEKTSLVKRGFEEWAKEPVSVNTIDEAGLKDLIKNLPINCALLISGLPGADPVLPNSLISFPLIVCTGGAILSLSASVPMTPPKGKSAEVPATTTGFEYQLLICIG